MAKLNDEEYKDLKGDPEIRDAIIMLQDIHFKFGRVSGSDIPEHTEFLYGNFAKIPITKKERTAEAKKIKSSKRKEFRIILKQTNNLIENGFIDTYLSSYLNINKKLIAEALTEFIKLHQGKLENLSRRVRPDSGRDFWLGQIIITLYHMGYTQSKRIEFMYKLYLEANWDLYATFMYGEEDKEWADEKLLKDVLKQVDRKILKHES